MTVAVLALQGAFIEHEHVLEELGVKTVELRQAADLDQPYDGLILPGGESTVQGKLLRELKMFDPLKKQIADGMPVLGTCAGLILLGSPEHFGTIPMQVKRNAYGRQLGSFHTKAEFKDLGIRQAAGKLQRNQRKPHLDAEHQVVVDADTLGKQA